jgi:protein SCO1/2
MFCTLSRRSVTSLCAACLLFPSCAKHYRAQGIVLDVDRSNRTVTISHRAIPGYMDAMAMPFHAEPAEHLDQLSPGSRIEFQLKIGRKSSTVRHIGLQQPGIADVPLPKAEGKVAIGDSVPDFTLTDQAGHAVQLSEFRGQLVAVDFIYTRCPMPDVCPRLSANFARLQKRFSGKIVLLSISLDPEYDTPAVLTDYAQRWRADSQTWRFLTGSMDDVRRVAGRFGVVYWAEEGAITHTSSTAIVDRDGRLRAVVEGSSFTSQQLIDLVEALQGAA